MKMSWSDVALGSQHGHISTRGLCLSPFPSCFGGKAPWCWERPREMRHQLDPTALAGGMWCSVAVRTLSQEERQRF